MPNITLHDGTSHVELRRADESVYTWIERGLWEIPEHRGKNTVIDGKPGEDPRPLQAARRIIVAPTVIKAATEAALLTLVDEITAVWLATQAQPRELRVYGPLYGIPSGFYRKLNVRYFNDVLQWQTARVRAKYSVEYVCVDSPPNWTQVAV